MDTKVFDELYGRLNAEQKTAVDAVEGPVMVGAGPGTGKTQILTLRIANILKTMDVDAESILALTFTEAAAREMRERLVRIIGSSAYQVSITTFHSFCNEIIQHYAEHFPHIIGRTSITEVDQIQIIETLVDTTGLDILKPFGDPLHYVRPILQGINGLKREGVSADEFLKLVAEEVRLFEAREDLHHEKGAHAGKMKGEHQKFLKQLQKNKELAQVYVSYEEELAQGRVYDFNDMIMEVLHVLRKDEALLQIVQEQYQYILVDEHQDTNNAQNKILELLCNFHDSPNLFVVGDEKQAIFRFQGASLENFLYFQKLYPSANLVVLKENYRSTQEILDASHSVIAGTEPLRSNAQFSEVQLLKIGVREFLGEEDEVRGVVALIGELIADGTSQEEIAVLYRDNRDAFAFARGLEQAEIPFVIESDQNILDDEHIRKLLLVLKTIVRFGDNVLLAQAMHVDFFGIDAHDVYRLLEHVSHTRMKLCEVLAKRDGVDLESEDRVRKFYEQVKRWKIVSENKDVSSVFASVVRDSGLLRQISDHPDSAGKLDKLNTLFDEAKSFAEGRADVSLKDFLAYLEVLETHKVLVRRVRSHVPAGRVRLMTAHRSKGLEFDYVFIVGCHNGKWGGRRRPEKLPLLPQVFALGDTKIEKDETGDERRLFYVALTRARKGVSVSFAKEGMDGRLQIPSQFITEIKDDLVEYEAVAGDTEIVSEDVYAERKESGVSVQNKEFVRGIFERNGLSVSALNNYLECPWKYFYVNLLRIPQAPEPHLFYGTAVHAALNDVFKKDGTFSAGDLVERFRAHLGGMAIAKGDVERWQARGEEALRGWYEAYAGTWEENVMTELRVKGVNVTPDIRLVGMLDKVEILNDRNEVNVVDYKTGKPKSRNFIEGKLKDGTGNIFRQLVFYKLLLDGYKEGKYTMISGEIDFVEPNDRGKYKKEKFDIGPKDTKDLEGVITDAADEILNLKFWDQRCDDVECTYCLLRFPMQSG